MYPCTVDYGATVSGFPVFGVKAASGSYVEVEFKYSEQEGWATTSGPVK